MRRRVLVTAILWAAVAPHALASHRDGPEPPRTPRLPREPGAARATPDAVFPDEPERIPARPRTVIGGVRPKTQSRARAQVVSEGPESGRRMIALTLDDGYKADLRILDLIDQWELKGTAFLVGSVASSDPWLVQRLVRAGWEVCTHTYSHRTLTRLDEWTIEREIVRGAEALEELGAPRCRWFRPPSGAVSQAVVDVARRLGYTVVNWNASISDSTSLRTPTAVQVRIALDTIRPGAILLGHFGGAHSFEVLREVLQTIFERGYSVGTVSDLLEGGDADEARVSFSSPAELSTGGVPQEWPARVPPGGWAGAAALCAGAALVGVSLLWGRRGRIAEPVAVAEPAALV